MTIADQSLRSNRKMFIWLKITIGMSLSPFCQFNKSYDVMMGVEMAK
jgi:hypothetical protein